MIVNFQGCFQMPAKNSLKSLGLREITTCYPTTPPPRTGTASEFICVVNGVKNWSLPLATLQHVSFWHHPQRWFLPFRWIWPIFFSLVRVISYFLSLHPSVDKVLRLC